jgi:hypothetical protein
VGSQAVPLEEPHLVALAPVLIRAIFGVGSREWSNSDSTTPLRGMSRGTRCSRRAWLAGAGHGCQQVGYQHKVTRSWSGVTFLLRLVHSVGEGQVRVDEGQPGAGGFGWQWVAQLALAYLTYPPVVLVLVVDQEGQDVSADGSLLAGCADVAGVDGGHLSVDACCDRCSEGGKLVQAWQVSAAGFRVGGVHQCVQSRVRAGLGGGEVAEHEVSDVGLVAQMPADRARVGSWSPFHFLGS